MQARSLLIFLLFPFLAFAQSEEIKTYKELCKVNKEWVKYPLNSSFEIQAQTDEDLIQAHLMLVEQRLRQKDISHLPSDVAANRQKSLDFLREYRKRKLFPKNLYHKERTPYFIDDYGTACAVGYLVIRSGHSEFAEYIRENRENNNYAYIAELNGQYPQLKEWADANGFTIDELAWIQPTYGGGGNPCTLCSSSTTQVFDVSCNGSCDGAVSCLPDPMGAPPYMITGPDCSNLCAGTYTWTIEDSQGTITTYTYTINEPPLLSASISSSTNVSCNGYCDGQATVSASGGVTPYSYLWDISAASQTSPTATGLCAGSFAVTVTDVNGCTAMTSAIINEPPLLAINALVDNDISCFGGSDGQATANASGGTSGYAFAWPGGQTTATATGLSAGSYTVTVTDTNNCTIIDSVIITEPPVLATSITGTNISCAGLCDGSADLSVSGGTTFYSYIWSNGSTTEDLTSLCAGIFDVTVTDNNFCTVTSSVTITEPAVLVASIIATDVNCNGVCDGSANLSISGGATPYSYNWSNGSTTEDLASLCTGVFEVSITDVNLCTANASVTITEPVVLSTSIIATDASCNGLNNGSATANVTGGTSPYTYLWSQGSLTSTISGVSAGVYQVSVTDSNNCTIVDTAVIEEPQELLITGIADTSSANINDGSIDITVTGGVLPYSYLWSNGETTEDLAGIFTGEYLVTVTDGDNCNVTDTFIVEENVGASTLLSVTNKVLKVYPNPAGEEFVVGISTRAGQQHKPLNVTVRDMGGKVVGQWAVREDEIKIRTEGWKAGVYLVELIKGGQVVERTKLVIQ